MYPLRTGRNRPEALTPDVIRSSEHLAHYPTQPLQTGYQLYQLHDQLTVSIDLDALEGPTPAAEG